MFFSLSIDVEAYVNVKGYYRKDGTYVKPHVRSNPNGLKYDNYGYTPSQGLYNKSYGTKGSTWDTPTTITDPDYYTGKYLYENNLTTPTSNGSVYTPTSTTSTTSTSVVYPSRIVGSKGKYLAHNRISTANIGDTVNITYFIKNEGTVNWSTWGDWIDETTQSRIFLTKSGAPTDKNQIVSYGEELQLTMPVTINSSGTFSYSISPYNRDKDLRIDISNLEKTTFIVYDYNFPYSTNGLYWGLTSESIEPFTEKQIKDVNLTLDQASGLAIFDFQTLKSLKCEYAVLYKTHNKYVSFEPDTDYTKEHVLKVLLGSTKHSDYGFDLRCEDKRGNQFKNFSTYNWN
jgi:hypothetical protein